MESRYRKEEPEIGRYGIFYHLDAYPDGTFNQGLAKERLDRRSQKSNDELDGPEDFTRSHTANVKTLFTRAPG